jgi:GTP cyclohydrolase I
MSSSLPPQRATAAIAPLVKDWLSAIGEDPARHGLRETPRRVAQAWAELTSSYITMPPPLTMFREPWDQMVVCRDIEFVSLCEHHLLPFHGMAHIAYIPSGRILGLSKLPRLVEWYSRKLQVQERLTHQIADHLRDAVDPEDGERLAPKGVAVVLEGQHLCMSMRGVRKEQARMVTSALRGCMESESAARAEFYSLIGRR